MFKLTKEILENAKPRSVVTSGFAKDDPSGVNMTNSGQNLRWVLCRGEISDWCVYVHYAHQSIEWIKDHGDKPFSRNNIENIIEFDDEVWDRYRF